MKNFLQYIENVFFHFVECEREWCWQISWCGIGKFISRCFIDIFHFFFSCWEKSQSIWNSCWLTTWEEFKRCWKMCGFFGPSFCYDKSCLVEIFISMEELSMLEMISSLFLDTHCAIELVQKGGVNAKGAKILLFYSQFDEMSSHHSYLTRIFLN